MDDLRDRIADAYETATDHAYRLYTDDRIRRVEETGPLSHLSTSERYETLARNDAEVLRTFERERTDASTTRELDGLYDAAREDLALTGSPLIAVPSRDDLKRNAPRTAAKMAAKRALAAPAGIALDVEYGIANTLRRANTLDAEGEELEAELMRAAALDRIPFTDPDTSTDRLDTLYEERRDELAGQGGSPLWDALRDAFPD